MAVTYDSTLATDKDKVRFLIQDTDITMADMQDEEIMAMISMYGSYKSAAVNCAEVLAAKFAGDDDSRYIGTLKLENRDKANRYLKLANTLRKQLFKFVVPYLGGLSHSDKETNELDEDIVQPAFKRGIFKRRMPDPTTDERI